MGENSAIQWTNHTWNPWMGCHKVSAGCKHCYMFREQKYYGHDPNVVRRGKTTFNKPLSWHDPARVFTCSWSDWFIEEADEWRDEAWEIVRQTPHLDYQILTKRPENIRDRLPADWGRGWSNVWLGISAEDQMNANARIPILLRIPAEVHFISAEPLLGPIQLSKFWVNTASKLISPPIEWVIVGGESGPGCRPMKSRWARSLLDQCQQGGVAFFMKQMGGYPDKRGKLYQFPEDLRVREFPATRLEAL